MDLSKKFRTKQNDFFMKAIFPFMGEIATQLIYPSEDLNK